MVRVLREFLVKMFLVFPLLFFVDLGGEVLVTAWKLSNEDHAGSGSTPPTVPAYDPNEYARSGYIAYAIDGRTLLAAKNLALGKSLVSASDLKEKAEDLRSESLKQEEVGGGKHPCWVDGSCGQKMPREVPGGVEYLWTKSHEEQRKLNQALLPVRRQVWEFGRRSKANELSHGKLSEFLKNFSEHLIVHFLRRRALAWSEAPKNPHAEDLHHFEETRREHYAEFVQTSLGEFQDHDTLTSPGIEVSRRFEVVENESQISEHDGQAQHDGNNELQSGAGGGQQEQHEQQSAHDDHASSAGGTDTTAFPPNRFFVDIVELSDPGAAPASAKNLLVLHEVTVLPDASEKYAFLRPRAPQTPHKHWTNGFFSNSKEHSTGEYKILRRWQLVDDMGYRERNFFLNNDGLASTTFFADTPILRLVAERKNKKVEDLAVAQVAVLAL